MKLLERLQIIPEGFSKVLYSGNTYGVTKTIFNQGKSYKLYAKDLAGTNFISCNYYAGIKNSLKPCEMSAEKVLHFLENYISIES